VEPKVFFRRGNDRFLLFRDRPELYSNFHTTETWGTNLLANYFHNAQSVTTMGLDTRTETIWSNNLGEIIAKSIISPVNDTILLNRFHSRSQLSVFFGHKLYLGPFTLNAAVNFTRHSGQGLDWHVYPGFDASWQIAPQSSLYASVNKTMRMPTYTDLYYQSPNNQGNPSLKPEEALGFELGYQYKSRWIDGSVTAFQSRGSNMIDWVKETTDQKWQTVNYTNLNTTGVELAAKSDFQKASKENLFFRTISLAYTYMLQDKPDQELISNYALNFLKHRFDLSLDHSIWKGFSGHWHLAWQDRAGAYEKIVDQQSVGLTDYEPFFLVDLKVSWQAKGWNLYVSVNNLFATVYYDYGNVEQPGRWIKAGFIKKFDFHPAKR
jgi:iron complex outermembrane receptor protein